MMKFLLKNMGCKSNQLEGALIEENLLGHGYKKTSEVSDADYFVLNSCTVTHKSDNEAFSILKRIKKQNPAIKTVLTGCIAQVEKEQLLENPSVDIVLGNDEKLNISDYLQSNFKVGEIMDLDCFNQVLLNNTRKTRASLKIQDGCDNRCSYCIIPFARGKSRCADLDFILKQINIFEEAGFKEIMLTGIHIGQWRAPESKKAEGLLYLLENIEEKTNIKRFRLGSLNPLEISDEMLNFLQSSNKFCPHFHLSLQSMCDKTLKSMNRHYSVGAALDLIDNISDLFPLGFIGSDIIAGFVGESDEDFEITANNLRTSKLTQIHTFPYSIRKGTAAEALKGHLPQNVKDSRAQIIKDISTQKKSEFLLRNCDSLQEVLIEKNLDRKTGFLKGMTRNYLNVLIPYERDCEKYKNTIQNVLIQMQGDKILGKII